MNTVHRFLCLLLSIWSFAVNAQVVDFSTNVTSGCAPLNVAITNNTNPTNASIYNWDFGNGTTDTQADPDSVTYTVPGTYTINLEVIFTDGSVGVDSVMIEVFPLPTVDFTANATTYCVSDFSVSFTANAPATVSYMWDFGDGNTSTLANPVNNYTAFGNYDVQLTVVDVNGCSNTEIKNNYIQAQPLQANFVSLRNSGCAPFMTSLSASSTPDVPLSSHSWRIINSATASVVQTYTGSTVNVSTLNAGTYDVELIIVGTQGCSDTLLRADYLNVGNVANTIGFSSDAALNSICNGTTVNFTNTTVHPDAPDVSYFWDYTGDGTRVPADQVNGNTTFTYNNLDPGAYTVTLYVVSNGCEESTSESVNILSPRANFDVYAQMCNPTQIYFSNTSIDADTYDWLVTRNGTNILTENTRELSAPLSVSPGDRWQATLVVDNTGTGCTDTFIMSDTVPSNAMPTFTPNPFTNAGGSDCYPVRYNFDASSIAVSEQTISSYFWNFGNGRSNVSTDGVADNIYEEPGYYSPRLVIATDQGCEFSHTYTDAIIVRGPVANFKACDAGTCKDGTVNISDRTASVDSIVNRAWRIYDMDGNLVDVVDAADDPQPYRRDIALDVSEYFFDTSTRWGQLQQEQHFELRLFVEDVNGCVDSTSMKIRASEPVPMHILNGEQNSSCLGYEIFLTDSIDETSGLSRITPTWDFNEPNGSPVNGSPNSTDDGFIFTQRDTAYQVIASLTFIDLNNCDSTIIVPDTLNIPPLDEPEAGFEYAVLSSFPNCYSVLFTDTSNVGISSPISGWRWNFGDGNTSAEQNPTHVYTNLGTYTVTLTASNAVGCSNSISQNITVNPGDVSQLLAEDTIFICVGDMATLNAASISTATYLWSPGGETTSSINVSPTVSTTYQVEATLNSSSGGCLINDSVLVFVFRSNDVAPLYEFCVNNPINLSIDASPLLPSGFTATYRWSPTNDTTAVLDIDQPGTYTVAVDITYPDGQTCSYTSSTQVGFTPIPMSNPFDTVLCSYDDENLQCFQDQPLSNPSRTVTLSLDNLPGYTYTWNTNDGVISSSANTNSVSVNTAGTYVVTATKSNCTITDTFVVQQGCNTLVCFPNVFIPNLGSQNGFFGPIGLDVDDFELIIYNRWGEVVFHGEGDNLNGIRWNGELNGKLLPSGVYPYHYRYTNNRDKETVRGEGSVMLIR